MKLKDVRFGISYLIVKILLISSHDPVVAIRFEFEFR